MRRSEDNYDSTHDDDGVGSLYLHDVRYCIRYYVGYNSIVRVTRLYETN